MKPLNEKEMNSSFMEFALFFLVIVLVVYFAFFFDKQLPMTWNTHVTALEKTNNSSSHADIMILADTIQAELSRYEDCTGGDAVILQQTISDNLSDFHTKIEDQKSSINNTLHKSYQMQLKFLTDYRAKKDEIYNLNAKKKSDEEEIQRYRDKLNFLPPNQQ